MFGAPNLELAEDEEPFGLHLEYVPSPLPLNDLQYFQDEEEYFALTENCLISCPSLDTAKEILDEKRSRRIESKDNYIQEVKPSASSIHCFSVEEKENIEERNYTDSSSDARISIKSVGIKEWEEKYGEINATGKRSTICSKWSAVSKRAKSNDLQDKPSSGTHNSVSSQSRIPFDISPLSECKRNSSSNHTIPSQATEGVLDFLLDDVCQENSSSTVSSSS